MCSTSKPSSLTRSGTWSASTRAPFSSSVTRTSRSRPPPGGSSGSITSIVATAPVNLFVFVDAHRSWRRVKVTDRRTADDFALCMRELVDVDFPEAERIRVVLDNLSTHTAAALYAGFPPKRVACSGGLSSTTRPSTPAGSAWLRSRSACSKASLDRRIESCDRLVAEIDVWQSQRNLSGARINWMFSTDRPEPKWRVPIPIPRSKSHNLCAGELASCECLRRSRISEGGLNAGEAGRSRPSQRVRQGVRGEEHRVDAGVVRASS